MSAAAKSAGDAAFSAKNWTEALTQYNSALSSCDASDNELLKKIYSNRSAVHSASKNFPAALVDGEKAVELDSEWSKAHIRMGDALFGLHRWTEASNAYNKADRLEPGKGYDGKATLAINNRNAEATRRTQQQNANYASGKLSVPVIPTSGISQTIYNAAEKGLFILFLLYLLPLSWIPFIGSMFPHYTVFYNAVLLCSLTIQVLHIYCSTGFPKFSQDYMGRVMQIQGVHSLFLTIILFPTRPYMLAMAAIIFNHVVIRGDDLIGAVHPYLGQAMSSLPPQLATYKPQMEQITAMLSTPQGVQQFKAAFMNVSCTAEVMQGVLLIVELIMPTRNLIFLYLWWQYLLMRYIMDTQTGTGCMKTAFNTLDGQITTITTHSMCPGFVNKGYGMVKGYMIQQVESATQQGQAEAAGGGGGFMDRIKSKLSSCTIA